MDISVSKQPKDSNITTINDDSKNNQYNKKVKKIERGLYIYMRDKQKCWV